MTSLVIAAALALAGLAVLAPVLVLTWRAARRSRDAGRLRPWHAAAVTAGAVLVTASAAAAGLGALTAVPAVLTLALAAASSRALYLTRHLRRRAREEAAS